jgi:ATP-dependent RNA helicase RhlE
MEMIEDLIRKPVSLESVPMDVEITSQLLEDEKIQTRNIRVKNTVRRDTGAFHQKKAKNMKTPSGSKGRQKQLEAQKRNQKKRNKFKKK